RSRGRAGRGRRAARHEIRGASDRHRRARRDRGRARRPGGVGDVNGRTGASQLRGSRLVRGSAWILVGMAAQALLGFAFWTLGARSFDTTQVGRASGLFTIAQFLTYAAGLGLTVTLARFASDH